MERIMYCLFFLLLGLAPATAQEIGNATSVKPEAHANSQPLASGNAVHARDLVHTGSIGQADLRFHDDSSLTVGPSASVRLDKFVYDPNKTGSSVVIDATRGSFRFISKPGSIGQVKTPYGSLGIRG